MRNATCWTWISLLGLWTLGASPASSDSWMAPQARRDVAPDAASYLVLTPDKGTDAKFQLVRRTSKRPPADGPARVEAGDVVLASGTCTMPMAAWCLSKARGFVLFETYGAIGQRAAATCYDGKGRLKWQRTLADLFTEHERSGFRNTVGSTWWYETAWVDEAAGNLVVVYETPRQLPPDAQVRGPNAGPRRTPGVLRIGLATGAVKRVEATHLLGGLAVGSVDDRLKLLDALGRARPVGWDRSLGSLLADANTDDLLRVKAAVELRRAGDDRGKAFVVATARAKEPVKARALALRHLRLFLGNKALPLLRAALRDEQRETGLSIYVALQDFGAEALDMEISMLLEEDAPVSYRRAAIGLISQLGAAAKRALPALRKVADHAPKDLAEEARYALDALGRTK